MAGARRSRSRRGRRLLAIAGAIQRPVHHGRDHGITGHQYVKDKQEGGSLSPLLVTPKKSGNAISAPGEEAQGRGMVVACTVPHRQHTRISSGEIGSDIYVCTYPDYGHIATFPAGLERTNGHTKVRLLWALARDVHCCYGTTVFRHLPGQLRN